MSKRPRPTDACLAPPALAAPPPPPASAGVDPLALLCPTCAFHFRAAPSPYAPFTFNGCGHSLCGLCVDSVTLAPAPHCPVCQAVIKSRAVNVALGELGEAVWAAAQPAPAAPVPNCMICEADAAGTAEGEAEILPGHLKCSKCAKVLCADHAEWHTRKVKGHVMEARDDAEFGHTYHSYVALDSGWCEDRLRVSAARLTPAAEAMIRGIAVAQETIAALGTAKDSAVKQIEAEMDALFVRLFAYGADMVGRVEAVYAERVKALEAQVEELAVTSAQLRAAAEVAARALALPQSSAALNVPRAYTCVNAVGRLVGDRDPPALAATAILRIEFAPLLTCLDDLATLITDNSLAPPHPPVLTDSTILGHVDAATVAAFRRVLTAEWLASRELTAPDTIFNTKLLYRGSRHGMTPVAFHTACNGMGPTVTLIRSTNGYTFGGYTAERWNTPRWPCSTWSSTFLFSVTGPHGNLTLFPTLTGGEGKMWCDSACGPCFGSGEEDGIVLCNSANTETDVFDQKSRCGLPQSIMDSLGKGNASFTGAETFTPEDVEVWSLTWESPVLRASQAVFARYTRGFAEMSSVLSYARTEDLAAFLRLLPVWLPPVPRRAYTLLYRGSRDGISAREFHRRCDGKGPTLVLARSDKGWVFGGYAGASWCSGEDEEEEGYGRRAEEEEEEDRERGTLVASGDAFLFSVTGPYTDAPVRFPVKADKAGEALYCIADRGPCFQGGLNIDNQRWRSTGFDASLCHIGEPRSCYEDCIGRGNASLTGETRFTCMDVEVYAVTQL